MFWIIFFGVLLFLTGYILFTPIFLYIDWNDDHQRVELHWWGVIRARLVAEEEEWQVQLHFLWLKKRWPLLTLLTNSAAPSRKKEKKGKKRRGSWKPRRPVRMLRRLWRSFHVVRFRLYIDTDDYVTNAYLFPIFRLIRNWRSVEWGINFQGRNEITLHTENRLSRIVYAVVSSL